MQVFVAQDLVMLHQVYVIHLQPSQRFIQLLPRPLLRPPVNPSRQRY
jgi:hypothetical protein